jgi:hypothetical protein
MAYKSGADGITKSGKTKGKQLGIDGKKVGTESGGKGSKGVSSEAMKSMGRNLARVANQG